MFCSSQKRSSLSIDLKLITREPLLLCNCHCDGNLSAAVCQTTYFKEERTSVHLQFLISSDPIRKESFQKNISSPCGIDTVLGTSINKD